MRHAAHGHRLALMLAAETHGDGERLGAEFGILEEHFVEIAHAEEDQRIGLLCLHGEPLGQGGGRAEGARGIDAEGARGGGAGGGGFSIHRGHDSKCFRPRPFAGAR